MIGICICSHLWYNQQISKPQAQSRKSESEICSVMSNSLWPHGVCSPWNSLGQNPRVGSLFLPQEIFPTQGSNPSLPHCRRILYQLSHKGSPRILEWVDYPFSSGSSDPGVKLGSPALQVDSLPIELSGTPLMGRAGWYIAAEILRVLCFFFYLI